MSGTVLWRNWFLFVQRRHFLHRLVSFLLEMSHPGHHHSHYSFRDNFLSQLMYFFFLIHPHCVIGKNLKSVFNFLTHSREIWFWFSYGKVKALYQPIGASDEIDRVSKSDNSLSFGAKRFDFLKIYLRKIQMEFFLDFLWFCVGSI